MTEECEYNHEGYCTLNIRESIKSKCGSVGKDGECTAKEEELVCVCDTCFEPYESSSIGVCKKCGYV